MKKHILVIGLVFLLLFSSVVPISIGSKVKIPSNITQSFNPGKTLYVGGSGPNNYTKIQYAIDNASDGDTLYVCNDSSPYYGDVLIDKSITLQGEERTSTIIKGGINITTNGVTVQGFTIEDSFGVEMTGFTGSGTLEHHNVIDGNIMRNVSAGVYVLTLQNNSGYNIISNNVISAVQLGIEVMGRNNSVIGNIVTSTDSPYFLYGITSWGDNTNISFNTVNTAVIGGIYIYNSYKTIVYRNNISSNGYGVLSIDSSGGDMILQNNIMNNNVDAHIIFNLMAALNDINHNLVLENHPILMSIWDENYWDRPRSEPYTIGGFFEVSDFIPQTLLIFFHINVWGWNNFNRYDEHPAQKPYDIEV